MHNVTTYSVDNHTKMFNMLMCCIELQVNLFKTYTNKFTRQKYAIDRLSKQNERLLKNETKILKLSRHMLNYSTIALI